MHFHAKDDNGGDGDGGSDGDGDSNGDAVANRNIGYTDSDWANDGADSQKETLKRGGQAAAMRDGQATARAGKWDDQAATM